MSDFSSQAVGAAACAKADDVSKPNAAVTKKVLIEILVIVVPPSGQNWLLPHCFEQITNAAAPSIRRDARPSRFLLRLCDSPHCTSRLWSGLRLQTRYRQKRYRDDSGEPR